MRSERGFTLIELLVVIAIISLLAALGATSFQVYKAKGYYSVVVQSVDQLRKAMIAGINDFDNPPAAVGLYSQNAPGAILDGAVEGLVPGFRVPTSMAVSLSYDPDCTNGGCSRQFVEARHCKGKEYVQFTEFGDGLIVYLDHIAGEGC